MNLFFIQTENAFCPVLQTHCSYNLITFPPPSDIWQLRWKSQIPFNMQIPAMAACSAPSPAPAPCTPFSLCLRPEVKTSFLTSCIFWPCFAQWTTCILRLVYSQVPLGKRRRQVCPIDKYRHLYTAVEIKILINHIISHLIWLVGPS